MREKPVQTMPSGQSGALVLLVLWVLSTLVWWGLAFPPFVSQPPTWLTEFQAVCFGTGDDGLPAPYGWGALIAAPMGMLGVLLAGWWRDLADGLSRLAVISLGRALIAVLVVLWLGQASFAGWRINQLASRAVFTLNPRSGSLPTNYPRLNRQAPAFTLMDQHKQPASLSQYRGRVVYLTFAFAHCTTACPLLLKNVQAAMENAEKANEKVPGMVVITLDAWRDTPAALAELREKWALPSAARLLTGSIPKVNDILDAYTVARMRDETTGDIDHPALVYVIDPQGRIAYALLNPSPQWLMDAAKRAASPPNQTN